MSAIPLRIGRLQAEHHGIVRSGFRWLRPDGHLCRPNEPIAFCNVGLYRNGPAGNAAPTFVDEYRDLQAVLLSRGAGRLRHRENVSHGGYLDQLYFLPWDERFEIGAFETDATASLGGPDTDPLRLMMVTGRRMTELAEVRTGIATGWHDRIRAWWGEDQVPPGTLLSMALCEQNGLLKGAAADFIELFSTVRGPAQVVLAQEEPLVPCARVLAEQITRTERDREAIAEDLARTFAAGPLMPGPADWLFMGALATGLARRPILDDLPVLTRSGLARTGPPAAILVSLNAELRDVGRHRRLGYTVACHDFRLAQSSPWVGQWLRANFGRVRRTLDDIRGDYLQLLRLLKYTTGARLIVINSHSTPLHEDVSHYAGFAPPLSETLAGVRAKELNLMLHDLAREHALDILDLDAAVARIGARGHIPDGIHWSGRLIAELRAELVDILQERGVPGFQRR